MKSVAAFVRSILPSDPPQLFFLLGSLFLYISTNLRFSPEEWSGFVSHFGPIIFVQATSAEGEALITWTRVVWGCAVLLFISGTAGLYLCLRPGNRPLRNILVFVWSPAVWAVGVICVRFSLLVHNPSLQMLSNPPSRAHTVPWIGSALSRLGPGLHFSVLGILCVSYFMIRMVTGRSLLPVSLAGAPVLTAEPKEQWEHISLFIWYSITFAFITVAIAQLPFMGLYYLLNGKIVHGPLRWIFYLGDSAGTAAIAGVAVWLVGSDRWRELRGFVRLPKVGYLGLGVTIAAVHWAFGLASMYANERVIFENGLGFVELPRHWLKNQFHFLDWYYFLAFLPAAFFEEIVYRGYLQPPLVRRNGLYRGVFLLGVFWAATHFRGDFSSSQTDPSIVFGLLWRPAVCIGMGFVLSWLTLRSGSILPAALAHGISNVYVESNFDVHPPLQIVSTILFWGLLAFLLYRYWPPKVDEDDPVRELPAVVEPAL